MAAAIAAAIPLAGCGGGQDDLAPAVKPAVVVFQGKTQAKYVGKWQTPDGNSTIEMLKDGAANLETVSHSMHGSSTSKFSGKWLVDGSNLMFQYDDQTKQRITLKYGVSLSSKDLVLSQANGRIKTTYKRK